MSLDPLEAYRLMYLCRATDEEICRRYSEGKIRQPVHMSIGQEACAVGVMMALNSGDHVFGGHRNHAEYLAKGGSLDAMIAELYGKATGCCGGRGGSMHLADESAGYMGSFPIVGDAISIATGAAFAFKRDGTNRRAVVFFGDAAVETGQFWESLNFAALHRLPILYVCENNGYATQTPIAQRQPATAITERVEPFVSSFIADGNLCVDVFDIASAALRRLPAFIEISTYRYRTHVGPEYDHDLGLNFRPPGELEKWRALDPLVELRKDIAGPLGIEAPVQLAITEAFRKAEEAPFPS